MPKVMKQSHGRPESEGNAGVPAPSMTPADDRRLKEKTKVRRFYWKWNRSLAIRSSIVVSIFSILSFISYKYHSTKTAAIFLQRSQAASEANNFAEQTKWLTRYSLLVPDDIDTVVKLAIVADAAADQGKRSTRGSAVDQARKQLSTALARASDAGVDRKVVDDLRKRLVKRLLQLGGPWYREAERQILILQPAREDADSLRSMALALNGQVKDSLYQNRPEDKFAADKDYWAWLSHQKVGEVLSIALTKNPQDLDLIAGFVDLAKNDPYQFNGGDLARRLDGVVSNIAETQSSRAQLILYQFESEPADSKVALDRLRIAAEAASTRLTNQGAVTGSTLVEGKDNETDSDMEFYWDFLVVLEAAAKFATQEKEVASGWYQQLMALDKSDIPSALTENLYLNAGRLSLLQEQFEDAISIWQMGLKQVDSGSLDLLGALASLMSQLDAKSPRTATMVDDFRRAVVEATVRLNRISQGESSAAQRTEMNNKLQAASWRLNVLEGVVAASRGDNIVAMNRYRQAVDADGEINVSERISVVRQLAAIYGREGLWDQAAIVLQKAVEMEPSDRELRALLAQAWTQAGNHSQAAEQWRLAGASDSLSLQIASVEASFNQQLRLLPEQRDFSGVRSSIKRIRNELTAAESSALDASADERRRMSSQVDVLEILLPSFGVEAEQHFRSAATIDSILLLANKHQDDELIQSFAAQRLAEAGRNEESTRALGRLETLVGSSATSFVLAKARLDAQSGSPKAASKALLELAETLPSGREDEVISILMLAAEFASRANDPELAYEALRKMSDKRRSPTTLYSLSELATNLPESSEALIVDGKRLRPTELSIFWEEELRKLEGSAGTYWRYLKVRRLMDQLQSDPNEIETSDRRLKEARSILREILALRPTWGEAVAMEGWLSAIERRHERAVEQLRRGIAAGDRRPQTRQRLFEQLIALNRQTEAEEELRLSSFVTNGDIDKYGTARIELAQRQGDFDRSLAVAKASIDQRPGDYLSHVVYCLAASVAASETKDKTKRGELLASATAAIEKAEELAGVAESPIFSARLRLHLLFEDRDKILADIERIKKSELDEYARLLLMSEALVGLQDFEAALPLLIRADELKPSTRTQMSLVRLYRQLRQEDDVIATLRTAQQRSPENGELRNELARALAARDGADVDWAELSSLLSTSGQVTGSNRFLYAVLLGTQGKDKQQGQAASILRELIAEQNDRSDDAARFMAVLLKKQAESLSEDQLPLRTRWHAEIRSVYETLVRRDNPQVVDVFRYATFLLDIGLPQDLPKVEAMMHQLESMEQGAIAALEIGIRYASKTGNDSSVPQLVASWAEGGAKNGSLEQANLSSIAGGTLLRLGFVDAGLEWLQRAYRDNPQTLANYVVALNQVNRVDEGIAVCVKHYENQPDPLSALLLVESILNQPAAAETVPISRLIKDASERFNDNPSVLESIATLRMQQNRFDEAITLYRQVQKLDPVRIRTLNNLAMALADIPGRAIEAIEPINQALKLAGDNPELLDTKGVVLLNAGRFDEAREVFQKAISLSEEPRFQFHMIMALKAQSKKEEARLVWTSLNLEKLDPAGLTATEREQLEKLKSEFGS